MDVAYIGGLVAQYVPAAPAVTVERAVNETIIDFCRSTQIWRTELQPVYLPAGATVVELVKEDTKQILAVVRLEVDGEQVMTYTAKPPRQVEFDDAYEEAVSVVGWAVLAPSVGCTNVPDVVEPWLSAIIDGTMARLATIHGQSWASGDVYAFRQTQYARSVHEARISLNRKGRNAVLYVSTPRI